MGIERHKIFRDYKDRDNFIDHLSDLLPAHKPPVMLEHLLQIMLFFYSRVAPEYQT